MTGKELRELARETLAVQLKADHVDAERMQAAIQILHTPMDPDEEREAQRKFYENAKAGGVPDLGLNSIGSISSKKNRSLK